MPLKPLSQLCPQWMAGGTKHVLLANDVGAAETHISPRPPAWPGGWGPSLTWPARWVGGSHPSLSWPAGWVGGAPAQPNPNSKPEP